MSLREELATIKELQEKHTKYARSLLPLLRNPRLEGGTFIPTDGTMGLEVQIGIAEGFVKVFFENRFRGESDWYSIEFPENLWGQEPKVVLAYLMERRAAEKRAETEARRRKEAEDEKIRDRAERTMYETLRKKYEGRDPIP